MRISDHRQHGCWAELTEKSKDNHNTSPADRTKSPGICASVTVANMNVGAELTRIMEWTHPLLTGLAMGHDEVVESHLERGWVHYEDYNHRFGY
ncbi:hypothetical protein, partial [Shewanella algae]|uniref:hypothetical protein n=1 Tax=Shewanella algae TaxID=38313 RepID=UPI001AAC9397